MKPTFVAALLSIFLVACIPPPPARDAVFANMRASYQTQLQSSLTAVDSAMAQFDGALTGLTDQQSNSPRYKSLAGRYDAVVKQYALARSKTQSLLEWAAATETTATFEDRNRLQSEAQALNIELSNLSATVHQLPAEINVIQMTVVEQRAAR